MPKYVPKTPRIGPYSAAHMLAKLDGRSREANLLRRIRADLLKHIGGNPTVVQEMLIQRACVLSLRLAQIDRKIFADTELTLHDNQWTVAWQNALTRTLLALGVHQEAARQPPPRLSDYLSGKHAA